MKYKKITIVLPIEVIKKYKLFCENNGMKISSRISILIQNDLKKIENYKESDNKYKE